MTRLRTLAANAALLIGAVAIALVVCEIALRILGIGQERLYVYDALRGWALNRNVCEWQTHEGRAKVCLNSEAFRGPEVAPGAHPGIYRIAVIGDSFTEAMQVPYRDTFCAVAQRELGSCAALMRQNLRPQVLDLGVDSYGTAQEMLTLREQTWKFKPDLVILAFFSGNDVRNNSAVLEGDKCRPFFEARDGHLVLGGPFIESASFRRGCRDRFESRKSAVLNELGGLHHVIMSIRAKFRAPAAGNGTLEPGLSNWIFRAPDGHPQLVSAWNATDAMIEDINRDTTAHDARFLAVTLAIPIQDNPDPAARERFMQRQNLTSLDYPDDRIRALGESDGFAVLNLAPTMRDYAEAHHVYLHGFSNTRMGFGHWNAEGHREAGRLIASAVCKMLDGASPDAKTSTQPPASAPANPPATAARH